jgi:hypothetical protein
MLAMNQHKIQSVHAQHICHIKNMGFNSDGLRPIDCLTDVLLKNVYKYKFQRISQTEIKRITLATLEEEIIGPKPNAKGEYMHVASFIRRRKQHARHRIFGAEDNEYWYGGSINDSLTKRLPVWQEIEARTGLKKADYTKWPWTEAEMRKYLITPVDDFNDIEQSELESPLTQGDPDKGEEIVKLKRRKNQVLWKTKLGLTTKFKKDIEDKTKKIDMRDTNEFVRASIITQKTAQVVIG